MTVIVERPETSEAVVSAREQIFRIVREFGFENGALVSANKLDKSDVVRRHY